MTIQGEPPACIGPQSITHSYKRICFPLCLQDSYIHPTTTKLVANDLSENDPNNPAYHNIAHFYFFTNYLINKHKAPPKEGYLWHMEKSRTTKMDFANAFAVFNLFNVQALVLSWSVWVLLLYGMTPLCVTFTFLHVCLCGPHADFLPAFVMQKNEKNHPDKETYGPIRV